MNNPVRKLSIRRATIADAGALTEFNLAMALETENKRLVSDTVTEGVERVITDSRLGFYLIAEHDHEIVGSLMITFEWSDWRNGMFWWIQSVYILPEWRRKGVFRRLYEHISKESQTDVDVCGLRLYVEQKNEKAKRTYEALGMDETDYKMFEKLKSGIKHFETTA